MASIYDIARITSGDPLGAAAQRAREAQTSIARHQHQKDIIEEINAAIAAAKEKQSKNKFGFGLGGGLLGSLLGLGGSALLSAVTGGAAAPMLMGMLGAGLGAGTAEKVRQGEWFGELTKREKITKELEEAQKKFEGRGQATDIGETKEVFEESLDQMLEQDIISSMLSALIMPTISKKVGEILPTEELAEEGVSELAEAGIGESVEVPWEVPGFDEAIYDTGFETLVPDEMVSGLFEEGVKEVVGESVEKIAEEGIGEGIGEAIDESMEVPAIEAPAIESTFQPSQEHIPSHPAGGGGQSNVSQTVPAEGVAGPGAPVPSAPQTQPPVRWQDMVNKADSYLNPLEVLNAINPLGDITEQSMLAKLIQHPAVRHTGRILTPPVYGHYTYGEPIVDDYATPQYTNPYRRIY